MCLLLVSVLLLFFISFLLLWSIEISLGKIMEKQLVLCGGSGSGLYSRVMGQLGIHGSSQPVLPSYSIVLIVRAFHRMEESFALYFMLLLLDRANCSLNPHLHGTNQIKWNPSE